MNEIEFAFPDSHPVFPGHFPGRPIVPGALLVAEALQALDRAGIVTRRRDISNAKFLSPVAPGERVTMRWENIPGRPLQITMSVGERRVASIVLGPYKDPTSPNGPSARANG